MDVVLPYPPSSSWAEIGFEGFGNFDPATVYSVCDNIVDATNLNDYVRELSLHFVVKLFVTTA